MIRELAANPNVHTAIGPGRELLTDPQGRFVIYLTPGGEPALRHRAARSGRG